MADYGGRGGGQSLRDALNQLYPMTGLGEYGAMFPPNAGAEQPGAPVAMAQQRPPVPGYPPPDKGLLTRPPVGQFQGMPPLPPEASYMGMPPTQGAPVPIPQPRPAIPAGPMPVKAPPMVPGGNYAGPLGLQRPY